ncbi:reverse transcriptase-like protein, partial [Bacillus spizizenii]|nr:reverse transcriptase-like protein [Bacillus spizizenii]
RGYQSVSFRTDSDIVERAAEFEMVKNKTFHPYVEEIIRLKAAFPLFFIKWIPGKQNQKADHLAKEAIRLNDKNEISINGHPNDEVNKHEKER